MLQWMGGSRRNVTTSRKSTHNRQKQYFEQRKRQREAPGLENHVDARNKQVSYNVEPRSLDILNLMNLAADSKREFVASKVGPHVSKISKNATLVRKHSCKSPTYVAESRHEQTTISSNSQHQDVSDACNYNGCVNKWKIPELNPESTTRKTNTFNEQKEESQIEVSVLDLLGDDGPRRISTGRSAPEAHVAFSVQGLGKIVCQTPTHSPRLHNRFSYKGFSSPFSRRAYSSSTFLALHSETNQQLNAMMDDFSVSPISSIGVLDEIGPKSIRISQVRQDANDKQQIKRFSTNGKEFQLSSYEQPLNDLFGFSEKKFLEEESSGAASINQTFNLKGYDFTSSNSEYKEHAPSDFLQDSRNSLEENDIFEASATSTAGFRHSKGKKRNQHVLWERFDPFNDGSVSNEFRSPAWSLLSKEVPEDNIGLFSEDSASSPAIRTGNNLKFGSLSTENRKSKSKLSGFMADFSQNENLFPGFDETVWQNELSSKSPCEILDGENSFIPFKAKSSLDLFDFAIGADSRSSAYKPESEVDHLNLFKMSKSKFVIPDALEPPSKFLYQNNLFEKQLDLNVEHQTPTGHSSKAEGHGEFCKGIHFADFPKQQDDKEDRGSCEKPEAKDYEMKSTSSLNAESAAGIDGLSKVNLDEESKGESLEQSHTKNGHLYGETEVVPTPMEEVPSQLQNYVRDQLNNFPSRSPVQSELSNKDSRGTFGPETKKVPLNGDNSGVASYQVMLQSYVLQLLCVQKVLLEASGKDFEKEGIATLHWFRWQYIHARRQCILARR